MFRIESLCPLRGLQDTAYADDPGGAFLAAVTLRRELPVQGGRVKITNEILGKVVYEGNSPLQGR